MSNFKPTPLVSGNHYPFTLGDKIRFYWRDKSRKAWKAFSDSNPYYAAYIESGSELMLAFLSIQKDQHTNGVHIGRLCPLQKIISRGTHKAEDGNWYTTVIIEASSFFHYHQIGFIIIPQTIKPAH